MRDGVLRVAISVLVGVNPGVFTTVRAQALA
jgi:hypothetical protein